MAVGAGIAYHQTQKIGEEGFNLAQEGEGDYDMAIQNLTQIADNVGLSSQDYKLRDTYFQVAEELTNAGVADADEIAQSLVAGIGDSRTEMSALGKLKDLMKGKRDARLEGAMLKLQGETGLTERAAKLTDQQTGMYYDIADTRERDLARINTGMDAYFGAQAALAEGALAMGNTLTASAISASGTPDQRALARAQRQGGGGADGADGPNYGAMRFKSSFQNAPADIRPGTVDMSGAEGYMQGERYNLGEMFGAPNPEYGYGDPLGIYYNTDLGDVDDFPNQSGLAIGQYYRNEQGGYIAEDGGVTKGEFSHETNKKAIIDEENGQKEGELTGGEVVFNPEQTDKIEDFLESRDADGLLGYMSMLFSLPQFQKA